MYVRTGMHRMPRQGVSSMALLLAVSVLFLLMWSGSADISVDRCPTGFPRTTTTRAFNGRCYQFVSEERYWDGARDYCIQHGGRLAKINDPDTNQFIVNTLNDLWWQNNGVWIGLHDRNVELGWQWIGETKTSNEPATWFNWASGHPKAFLHSIRDCVRMARGVGRWLWHETPCSLPRWQYRFICEYGQRPTDPIVSSATTTTSLPLHEHTVGFSVMYQHKTFQPDFHDRGDLSTISTVRHILVMEKNSNKTSLMSNNAGAVPMQSAMQSSEEQVMADSHSKANTSAVLVVAVSIIVAVVILSCLVYLVRRYRRSKRVIDSTSNEPSFHDVKADPEFPKSPLTATGIQRVESNIYKDPCTASARAAAESTEKAQMTGHVEHTMMTAPEEVGSVYCPMDGTTTKSSSVVAAVRQPCMEISPGFYLPMKNSSPKYSNCMYDETEEQHKYSNEEDNMPEAFVDYGMKAYDVPRPSNIYSEIPGSDMVEDDDTYEKCHIYESVDQFKRYP